MRSIFVSTEVYAALWAARQAGEEDENAILRRLLKAQPEIDVQAPSTQAAAGLYDRRTGTQFSEGFRVYRRYKGRDYTAVVRGNRWVREDSGAEFGSLNELNSSIVAGQENVWNGNWKLKRGDGTLTSIASIRGKLASR